jgi:hypothetical protein
MRERRRHRRFSSTLYVLEKWRKAKMTLFALRVEKAHGRAFSTTCQVRGTVTHRSLAGNATLARPTFGA